MTNIRGYDKRTREHFTSNSFMIHNIFGSFFSGVLNWFSSDFYPRFNYKVIGTYSKAIEYFKKLKTQGNENLKNLLPSITLDPMLDFSNAEQGGRFLWQHSRYAPGIGIRVWPSIDLKEQDILITPVYSRYQGTYEVTFWLSSIYELMDFRVSLLQFCGGFNRWCRPEIFWTYLMLSEDVSDYEKQDGTKIDWGNTLSDIIHVQTINKHKRVIPINLHPIWRLESFSDSSTKFGGDSITEYKLSASFTYEVNIPTYVVVSENVDPTLTLNLSLGNTYTKYPLVSPDKVLISLENTEHFKKYFTGDYSFFKIEDDILERDNLLVEFSPNSLVYPEKIQRWNYISSGVLLHVNDSFISKPNNVVKRDNIIVIDYYKPEYLPYIRKALAVISLNDTGIGEFYSKCEILKKPCICNLIEEERQIVLSRVKTMITIDTRRRRLYKDELAVVQVENNDPELSYRILKDIKDRDIDAYNDAVKNARDGYFPYDLPEHRARENINRMMKRLVCDYTNGLQTDFLLNFIIDNKNYSELLIYVDDVLQVYGSDYDIIDNSLIRFTTAPRKGSSIYIGGELMVIKESKLISIYEFTQDDVEKLEIKPKIKLPQKIYNMDDLVVISYKGKLIRDFDYSIDFENQEVVILITPIVGEIVQFFYYV